MFARKGAFLEILVYPEPKDLDFATEVFAAPSDSTTRALIADMSHWRATLCAMLRKREVETEALERYAALWFCCEETMRAMRSRLVTFKTRPFQFCWKGPLSKNMFSYRSICHESYMLALCWAVHSLRRAAELLDRQSTQEAAALCTRAIEMLEFAQSNILKRWTTRLEYTERGTAPELNDWFSSAMLAIAESLSNECLAAQIRLKHSGDASHAQSLCSKLYIFNAERLDKALELLVPHRKSLERLPVEAMLFLRDYYRVRAFYEKAASIYPLGEQQNDGGNAKEHDDSMQSSGVDNDAFAAAFCMLCKANAILSTSTYKKRLSEMSGEIVAAHQRLARLNDQVYFVVWEKLVESPPESVAKHFPISRNSAARNPVERNPLASKTPLGHLSFSYAI